MIKLSNSVQAFQWSTLEQVYPFEVDNNGATLYCKEINLGTLPNSVLKLVPHNISGLTLSKVRKLFGYFGNASDFHPLPQGGSPSIPVYTGLYATPTNIGIIAATDLTMTTGIARIIYAK